MKKYEKIYKETVITIRRKMQILRTTLCYNIKFTGHLHFSRSKKKMETSQYRHYRKFVFRQTCRSDVVIFNHYRSPLVISERNIPEP